MENLMIDEYLKKGLAIKKGVWYYRIDESGNTVGKTLGKTRDEANDKLLASLSETNQSLKPISQDSINSNSQKVEVKKNVLADKYAKILGSIKGISTDNTSGDLIITINGVDSRKIENKAIKECPFSFYWLLKAYLQPNKESGWMIFDYNVVNKNLPEWDFIKVLRDDSVDQSYYSVGELVLCFTSKESYEKRKNFELANGKIGEINTYDSRKETAKNVAASKSIEEAEAILTDEINKDKEQVYGQLLKNDKTKSEALKELAEIGNMDKLNEAYMQSF